MCWSLHVLSAVVCEFLFKLEVIGLKTHLSTLLILYAVAAEKQRLAEEVASILKISVEIDNSFVKM